MRVPAGLVGAITAVVLLSGVGCRTQPIELEHQRTSDPNAIVQIAAKADYGCAVRANGRVLCWGGDYFHGLWTEPLPLPREIAGVDDAVQIGAGDMHACARRRNGSVVCW